MPELPEVQTVVNGIKSKVINRLKNKGFYWVNIENVINATDDN